MTTDIADLFKTVAVVADDIQGVLGSRRSYEAGENPSGERQLAADVYADEQLTERLLDLEGVVSYASEEREEIRGDPTGEGYHISADPLDGSSNLRSNNAMGTIIGIYDQPLPVGGEGIIASAYVLYGPITTMVTSYKGRVQESLIEDGSLVVLSEDVALPEEPTVYGFGGRVPDWGEAFTNYVEEIEDDRLKLRYGGAMVGDVNQVLTYGGIFGYPRVSGASDGKLRLQFEGVPMAHIIESAGGASTDGEQSLLSKEVANLHQRSPIFVGTEALIGRLERALGAE